MTNLGHAQPHKQSEEACNEPAPCHGDDPTIRQPRAECRCDASHHGQNCKRYCEVGQESAQKWPTVVKVLHLQALEFFNKHIQTGRIVPTKLTFCFDLLQVAELWSKGEGGREGGGGK